jgi:oligopeptide/dipeptide ABC transporter ATP-binding protein
MPAEQEEPDRVVDTLSTLGQVDAQARAVLEAAREKLWAAVVGELQAATTARVIRLADGTQEVLSSPKHPYTQLLLSAAPDPRAELNVGAETDHGEPPKVINPTPGCRFRWRCPIAVEVCHSITPELLPIADGHEAACHVAQSGPEVKAF